MIINNILFKKYGKFTNREFTFSPRLNIIFGKNETGKSTLATALKTFFYTDLGSKNKYKKTYIPLMEDKGAFDVNFVTDKGEALKSLVTLGKTNGKTLVKTVNTGNGEELNGDFSRLGEHFFNISEEMFDSVCYIRDLQSVDKLIANKSDVHDALSKTESGPVDIDLSGVLKEIKDELLEYKRPTPTGKIYPVEKRIEEIDRIISDIEDIKEAVEGTKEEIDSLVAEEKQLSEEFKDFEGKEKQLKEYTEYENARAQTELLEEIKKDEELKEKLKPHFTPIDEDDLERIRQLEASKKTEKNLSSHLILTAAVFVCGLMLGLLSPLLSASALLSAVPLLLYFKGKKFNDKLKEEKEEYTKLISKYSINGFEHYLKLKEDALGRLNEIKLIEQRIEFNKKRISQFNPEALKTEIPKPDFNEAWVTESLKRIQERLYEIKTLIASKNEKVSGAFNNLPDISELTEEKKELTEKLTALKYEEQIATDCYNILNITNNSFKASYIPYLNREVADILEKVLGNIDYFNIKDDLTCEIRKTDALTPLPKENFSNGTDALIYFAIRLAMYKLISGEEKIPLILDDCFLELDSERFGAILKYISENITSQIFYFTSSERIFNLTLANSTINRL